LSRKIELLAPAKNYELGKYAINFGADAIYIGAPSFSARASASNSVNDIEKLSLYAHKFEAKVYVALNTILYENELVKAEKLIWQLYNSGIDALIIQDLGILEMDLPPIPLHASTQTHNTDIKKIHFLQNTGFERVVLARELSLDQIAEIKNTTQIELEAFIHGALCVSYSGQCYISHYLGGRSGNRGECAQACRLPFDLVDAKGDILLKNKHLLSLKDMNRADYLTQMVDAGVCSFKIEGRMKDDTYVKNITAFYRKKLDAIIEEKHYKSTSSGIFIFDFAPDSEKTFNRKYTDYFLTERKTEMQNLHSPKALGKTLGKVTQSTKEYFKINSSETIQNGDGLCFFNENEELIGIRVEKIEEDKIFTKQNNLVKKGFEIYRNNDHQFVKKLNSLTNSRYLLANLIFKEIDEGFTLTALCHGYEVEKELRIEKILAQNIQKSEDNLKNQLQKTGDTVFKIANLKLEWSKAYFIQTSKLNELRRSVLDKLYETLGKKYIRTEKQIILNSFEYFEKKLDYKANVSNSLAFKFYKRHGVEEIEKAFELSENNENKQLMITKLCIKYNLGWCEKYQKPSKAEIPKYLKYNDKMFLLEFDCKNCQMKVSS